MEGEVVEQEHEDVKFLVKFVLPEHKENTLDGSFFFKNCGYFIDLEKEQKQKGIGDKHEASWSRNIDPETEQISYPLVRVNGFLLKSKELYFVLHTVTCEISPFVALRYFR